MALNYKIENKLKNLPFQSNKIKDSKKNNNILSELPFFSIKLSNIQLSKELPFFPKRSERPRRLTKHQILKNILPYYETVGITRKQHAFRNYTETYEVEIVDKISLSDSLFLAKSSIIELLSDLLRKKRGIKYILSLRLTLKRWNNASNIYDIDTIFRNSDVITVINTSYETLKHRLNIYSSEGSG